MGILSVQSLLEEGATGYVNNRLYFHSISATDPLFARVLPLFLIKEGLNRRLRHKEIFFYPQTKRLSRRSDSRSPFQHLARVICETRRGHNVSQLEFPSEKPSGFRIIYCDKHIFEVSQWGGKKIKLSGPNQTNSFHKPPRLPAAKEQIKFQAVRLKPVSSCHSAGTSDSPELFLLKVPAVTEYTKNYLAASPSSSITV